MKIAVFDCETKNAVTDWSDYGAMGIACVVVEDNWTVPGQWRARIYQEEEIELLVRVLEEAHHVVSYNGKRFDNPLIQHFAEGDPKRYNVDLFELIERSAGRRYSLDNIAEATLGVSKSAK